jgi:protein dithiol oxidoreductase (disulfide-forming)
VPPVKVRTHLEIWTYLAITVFLSNGCDRQTGDVHTATPVTAGPVHLREGKDYVTLPASPLAAASHERVEVIEVFWYGCRYCYSLDRLMQSWHASDVEFRRVPGTAIEAARTHARLFYTVQALGQLERLHGPIFHAVLSGNRLDTPERMQTFLGRYGIDGQQFRSAFFSEAVDEQMARADAVTQQYKVDSVPSIVIDGRYKTDLEMAGGEQRLLTVIDTLVAHEQGR